MLRSDFVWLEVSGGPSAGGILRALHSEFGVPAEAVSCLQPAPGGVWLELDVRQGRRIVTPRPLDGGAWRGTLRRRTDLASPAEDWTLSIAAGALTAGALSRALGEAGVAAEDLGAVRRVGDRVEVTLPRWRYREADLPTTLKVGDDDHAVVVEKKNAADSPLGAESATEALAEVVAGQPAPHLVENACRRALQSGAGGPDLTLAVRALRSRAFTPEGQQHVDDPGLAALTSALLPLDQLREERAHARQIAFPTPGDRRWWTLLDRIIEERSGLPTARTRAALAAHASAWQTRAAGTLCPGHHAHDGKTLSQKALDSRSEPPATVVSREGAPAPVGLWEEWCALARRVFEAPSDVTVDDLAEFDRRVRDEADGRGAGLGAWPELLALVRQEVEGSAAPLRVALEALPVGSDVWRRAVLAAIDRDVARGRWGRAGARARRALTQRPGDVDLARRVVRLTGDTSLAVDDDVCFVLAAEVALRDGRPETAEGVLLAASPVPGTPAAAHAARRLDELGHPSRAQALLVDSDAADLRHRVAAHAGLWGEAVRAWAESLGSSLGLALPPDWASEAVLSVLSAGEASLLAGELSDAADLLGTGPLAARCRAAADEEPLPSVRGAVPAVDAVELVFQTPDPRVPLRRALAGISPPRALIRQLAREVPDSDWTDDLHATVERVLGASDAPTPDPHDLEARLQHALEATAAGRIEEATHVALAVGRKVATGGPMFRQIVALLLDCDRPDALVSALTPDRTPQAIHDVLSTLKARGLLPEVLTSAISALESAPVPERVRKVAAALSTLQN